MKAYDNILKTLGIALQDPVTAPSVYFLGIGGIGMSALARFFNSIGVRVSGYDKTPTPLTDKLTAEGMRIHFEDDPGLLDREAQFVVYTPAIPGEHRQLKYYQEHGFAVLKRSDVLGAITEGSFNICIAGTHGKTTTSTMVAHILRDTGYGCSAFLGGISVNYDTNFWSSGNNVCVVEADEYDRSFLKLSPDMAVVSSMDPDHLDIYGTAENMERAFVAFTARIRPGGLLLHKYGLKRNAELVADDLLTYHLFDRNADVYPVNIETRQGSYRFDVVLNEADKASRVLEGMELNMGGEHNIENILAAITLAQRLGIDDEKIRKAVAGFRGVKRRFEYVFKDEHQVFIDDYAHHPEELRALITGAKAMFPGKKCLVVFQPHLYSRTRDLADGFAGVLDLADEVILLPIYPARELPVEGVSSSMILDRMQNENKIAMSREALMKRLSMEKQLHVEEGFEGRVLITAGAGDIDTLVQPIRQLLAEQEG